MVRQRISDRFAAESVAEEAIKKIRCSQKGHRLKRQISTRPAAGRAGSEFECDWQGKSEGFVRRLVW